MYHHNTNKHRTLDLGLCFFIFLTEKWDSTLKTTLESIPKNNGAATFVFVDCHGNRIWHFLEKSALQILSWGFLRWPLSPTASETCYYYLPHHGTKGVNYSDKYSSAPIYYAGDFCSYALYVHYRF